MITSIRRRLLVGVLWTLGAGSLLLMGSTYVLTLGEMNEVFDLHLRQVAEAVAISRPANAATLPNAPRHGTFKPGDDEPGETPDADDGFEFMTIVSAPDGRLLFASDPQISKPFPARVGPSVVPLHGEDWHVYTVVGVHEIVQVAQPASARRDLATDAARQLIVLLFVLTCVITVLLIWVLRRGLAPLALVAADVASRSATSLTPLDARPMPCEIQPLTLAINELMQRLDAALRSQRLFVADAAHELRTPVAALRLQLQLLERAADAASRARAAAELRGGIDRSQRLIEQLLALSRTEPDVASASMDEVDLGEVVRSVVGQRSAEAERRRIDLGAVTQGAVAVRGNRQQLETMLGNLVDNAVAYAPDASTVDAVAAHVGGHPALLVTDAGPGIDERERTRVFDRFYRGESLCDDHKPPGSGLGLAIVKAIADRHGAHVVLGTAPAGRGLEVRVIFGARTTAP